MTKDKDCISGLQRARITFAAVRHPSPPAWEIEPCNGLVIMVGRSRKYRGGAGCLRKAIPLFVALIALGAVRTETAAADEKYPNGPIHFMVPFAAGGAVDIVGRLVGEQLSKALGQPVIVENVTGAGGTIAAARVARARPDGYTILVGNLGTQIASVGSVKDLPYNPRTDFASAARRKSAVLQKPLFSTSRADNTQS